MHPKAHSNAARQLFSNLVTTLLTLTFGLLSPVGRFRCKKVSPVRAAIESTTTPRVDWRCSQRLPRGWRTGRSRVGTTSSTRPKVAIRSGSRRVRACGSGKSMIRLACRPAPTLKPVFDPDGYQRLVFHESRSIGAASASTCCGAKHHPAAPPNRELERASVRRQGERQRCGARSAGGDRLSYRYTVEGRNPVFGQLFFPASTAHELARSVTTDARAFSCMRPPLATIQRAPRCNDFKTELVRQVPLRETTFERRDSPKLD